MRKVFLDDLPRWGSGGNKGKINWNESVGRKVPFVYEDLNGEIKIIDYDSKNSRVVVRYNNREINIFSKDLREAKISVLVGKRKKDFIYKIDQIVKDEKRYLTIIEKGYKSDKNETNIRSYKYKCNKCGFECGEHYKNGKYNKDLWINEYHLKEGNGCACCSNQVAVLGINTIWDKARWMVELGVSEEDAKRCTPQSHKKIEVTCPDCNNKKKIAPSNLYRTKTIGCHCNDKTPYPEKFMMSVLRQLGVDFETQLTKTTFKWCDKYRYDFYIPSLNMIIETHGEQHYEYSGFNRALEEEQENDMIKKELALKNSIDKYIVIDCRKSTVEWIKDAIIHSELNELFDLSKIDWSKAEEFALKNIVKEVCEYWNNKQDLETTNTIAKNNPWGIKSKGTVSKYLKKGANLGWTSYNSKEEADRILLKNINKNKLNRKKAVEIFKDKVSLGIFESIMELEENSEELFGIKLCNSAISRVCKGKYKSKDGTYKGFTFKYIEETHKLAS